MSRDIKEMCPNLLTRWGDWHNSMKDKRLPYMFTRVGCTWEEQVALFSQGRSSLNVVNAMRRKLGWASLTPDENSRKVTWTMNSKHIIRVDDDDPFNDCSRAFDIAILKGESCPTWEQKVDVNDNDIPDYQEAGLLWEKRGGVWGGRWKQPDYCHFQLLDL